MDLLSGCYSINSTKMKTGNIPINVDEYIASYPEEIRRKLSEMREVIRKAAPDAEEKISYRMAAYTLKGILVYFAGHANHIGFYPITSAIKEFRNELSVYRTTKGGIQFPYRDPLPLNLIKKIVEFRVRENLIRAEVKASKNRTERK